MADQEAALEDKEDNDDNQEGEERDLELPDINDKRETVKVVRVNKAKINYFFTERVSDVRDFIERGEIELRITMGKKWDNYVAVNKTPLLKQF